MNLASWALSQLGDHNRRAQGSEPHGDSTRQAGDGETHRRALQFMAGVARNLLVDIVCCRPVQIGLDG